MAEQDEIQLGDLVTYIPGSLYAIPGWDTRQLWLVVRISNATYTVTQWDGVDSFKGWHNREVKMQDIYKQAVRKELFQTQLMNAELHDWFLRNKGVVSAE